MFELNVQSDITFVNLVKAATSVFPNDLIPNFSMQKEQLLSQALVNRISNDS